MNQTETTNGKKPYFLYVNFDKERIGIRENKLEWQVGDFTIIKENQEKVMVYALMDLTDNGWSAVRNSFKYIFNKCKRSKFHEQLNLVVESLIELTSDESRCRKIKEQFDAEKAYRRMKAEQAAERKLMIAFQMIDKMGESL